MPTHKRRIKWCRRSPWGRRKFRNITSPYLEESTSDVARIFTVPHFTPVTTPFEDTVAILVSAEDQVVAKLSVASDGTFATLRLNVEPRATVFDELPETVIPV